MWVLTKLLGLFLCQKVAVHPMLLRGNSRLCSWTGWCRTSDTSSWVSLGQAPSPCQHPPPPPRWVCAGRGDTPPVAPGCSLRRLPSGLQKGEGRRDVSFPFAGKPQNGWGCLRITARILRPRKLRSFCSPGRASLCKLKLAETCV